MTGRRRGANLGAGQPRVLGPGLGQEGQVGIGVLPLGQEILVGAARLLDVTGSGVRAREPELGERRFCAGRDGGPVTLVGERGPVLGDVVITADADVVIEVVRQALHQTVVVVDVVGDRVAQRDERVRAQVGTERVLLGLSGGVDSSVVAALLKRAIGEK